MLYTGNSLFHGKHGGNPSGFQFQLKPRLTTSTQSHIINQETTLSTALDAKKSLSIHVLFDLLHDSSSEITKRVSLTFTPNSNQQSFNFSKSLFSNVCSKHNLHRNDPDFNSAQVKPTFIQLSILKEWIRCKWRIEFSLIKCRDYISV